MKAPDPVFLASRIARGYKGDVLLRADFMRGYDGRTRVLHPYLKLFFTGLLCIAAGAACSRGSSPYDQHIESGLANLQSGDFEAALIHFRDAANRVPTSATAYVNMGVAYWKLGNEKKAIEALTLANDLDGNDPRPLELLAHVLVDAGRYDDARRALDRANVRLPDQPRILTHLARVEYEAGEAGKAAGYLARALQVAPDYGPALYNMGVFELVENRNDEAASRYFRRYLGIHPAGARAEDARNQLAGISPPQPAPKPSPTLPSDSTPAETANDAQATAPPGNAEPPATRQAAPTQSGTSEETAAANAAELPPSADLTPRISPRPARSATSPQAHFKMAMTAHSYKDWPAAVRHYEKCIQLDSSVRSASYNLGLVYKELGEFEKARSAFARELQVNPAMVKAHYMLAVTLRELSQRQEAVDQCRQAISKDPTYGKAHYLLGLMHWENEDFPDARRHFAAAVQHASDEKSRERAQNWLKNLDQ